MSKPYKIVAKVGNKLQWESDCLKSIIKNKHNSTYNIIILTLMKKTILSYKREVICSIIKNDLNLTGTFHHNNLVSRIKHYV